MRALAFNVQKGGINRQRIKGGAKADTLYDLVNGYVTGSRTVVNRDGTVRDSIVASNTRGLAAFENVLHIFSNQHELYTPAGYLANVLAHPTDASATLTEIHFAQPFMGALYVVAEWSDGGIYHYWLASSGIWEADKVYFEGDVVTPTVPNGLLYKATPNNPDAPTQTWKPLTNYTVGDTVLPTTYNGYYYEVTSTQGDVPISGATEPAWSTTEDTTENINGTGAPASSASEAGAPVPPQDLQERYGLSEGQVSAASAAALALADTTAAWAPGTLYQPGALVKPLSVAPVVNTAIPNAGFESGDTGWDKDTGWTITNAAPAGSGRKPYQGSWFAQWSNSVGGDDGWKYLSMSTTAPIVAGQFLSASCYETRNNGPGTLDMDSMLVLLWYDAYDTLVKETQGTHSDTVSSKDYRVFTVQDVTPGGATKVRVAFKARSNSDAFSRYLSVDSFVWDYVNLTPVEADFTTYQAVQAAAATSGTDEPVWPGPGNTVVDGGVTWLGGITSVIVWTPRPIMQSGSTEPAVWNDDPNFAAPGATDDNTITWLATTGYVEQAPNSKYVALAAKKVFAGDDDIVRYSATVNPLDWTTAEDAGYLPYGLNTYGANPVAAMGLYRGNLVPFNSAGFQMWQLDPDPELMGLLDAMPIGSTYHKALQAVKNDLIFLTQLGYRSLGIAGGSTNLKAGDIGDPIDALVQAKLTAGVYAPNSIYYPARGQYWGIFGAEVFVCTFNDEGRSWSRYVFPEAITDATILNDDLYLRTATHKVWKVDAEALNDDMSASGASDGTPFDGVVWWPSLGGAMNMQLDSFDLVCTGEVTVQFGYDQRDPTVLTAGYLLDGDTLPGTSIPFPLSAPTVAPKLTFTGGQAWEWMAMNLYIQDSRDAGFAG
jgi:hypothetical protein